MINQFRNLNPINIVWLVAYTFFMRLAIFFNLPKALNFEFLESYAKLLIQIPLENALSPLANVLLATTIIFLQALLFNRIINNNNLLAKPSFLPALLYITGCSLFLQFQILSPTLICNFLLIWMLDKFFKISKAPNAMMMAFDIGMIIAIGTLIYFPFVVMLLLLWLGLLIHRSFSWREWLAGLIGFLVIFFFLAVFYYWKDNLTSFYNIWLPLTNKFPSDLKINYKDCLVLIPVAFVIVLALLQLRKNFFRSFISTRKAFQLLFFMFVLTMLSCYTKPNFRVYHFLLSIPAGSIILAYYFSNAKKRWFYETLFASLVIVIQYFLFV
jgi:hypothetical protein